MKSIKKIRFTILGALALITAVTLNVRHALNDYGVKDNKLHVEVLAQSSNSGGGGSGSGSGSGNSSNKPKVKMCREVGCSDTWVGTADVNGCIKIGSKRFCNYGANVKVTYTYFGKNENCTGGSDYEDCDACQKACVPS